MLGDIFVVFIAPILILAMIFIGIPLCWILMALPSLWKYRIVEEEKLDLRKPQRSK